MIEKEGNPIVGIVNGLLLAFGMWCIIIGLILIVMAIV